MTTDTKVMLYLLLAILCIIFFSAFEKFHVSIIGGTIAFVLGAISERECIKLEQS